MTAADAAPPRIAASGLRKRFGDTVAVAEVGLAVRAGEIFGLVGPDGAGKSTVVRMLAGVVRADAGQIAIDGIDLAAATERARLRLSYMPQRFGLYEDLTVEENIRFYADLFAVERTLWRARAAELLQLCGLAGFRGRLVGQLSGGMKQKLGLTCALVHAPRVLLLDEPTTGVDPLSRREFWHILYRLRAGGAAILISTAYLDEAERCDRLAMMHGGRVLLSDTPAALKARLPGVIVALPLAGPAGRGTVAALPGVLGVLAMGARLHVHLDAAARLPALLAGLAAAGLAVDGHALVEPSIEDLFVAFLPPEGAPA